ncbi:hypothetical protein HDU81_005598 [Chytriomyces hyalinus]|nr:hypothetical protein HDU81_005598 [Chytriomyces hyalinus]
MHASILLLVLSATAALALEPVKHHEAPSSHLLASLKALQQPHADSAHSQLSSSNSHLRAAISSTPAASFCAPASVVCVSAFPDPAADSTTFVVTSTAQGWAAVGMGSSMTSSTMFVGWTSRSFSIMSQRRASSYSLPSPVQPTFTQIAIPASFTVPRNARIAYAFTIPSSSSFLSSDFIYASSDASPSSPEDPNSPFGVHQQKGSFNLNLKGETVTVAQADAAAPASGDGVSIPATSSTSISSFCRDTSNSLCLVSIRDEKAATVTFVVYSSSSGWVGIGTGQSMIGATMFIGWSNEGQAVISQRSSSGYSLPSPVNQAIFTAVPIPAGVNLPSSTKISFAFSVPISAGIASTTSSSNFIFAGSSRAPGSPASTSSSFGKHEFKGQFSIDVSKLGQSSVGGGAATSAVDLLLIHGIFMFLAWGVLPPIAIFVARYLKARLGHTWYLTHMGLMLFGVSACIITALVCVEVNLAPGKTRFITTPHGIIGVTLCFAIYPMQVALGFISNALFSAERHSVPWWDQAHWWLGRSAVLLAVVNIHLGLMLYEASIVIVGLYWGFIGLVVLGVFGFLGEYRMKGAVHHVKGGFHNEVGSTPMTERLMSGKPENNEQGTGTRLVHSGSFLPEDQRA